MKWPWTTFFLRMQRPITNPYYIKAFTKMWIWCDITDVAIAVRTPVANDNRKHHD